MQCRTPSCAVLSVQTVGYVSGGFPGKLADDPNFVTGVNGQQLKPVSQIRSRLALGSQDHHTTIHVYSDLSDALLSSFVHLVFTSVWNQHGPQVTAPV